MYKKIIFSLLIFLQTVSAVSIFNTTENKNFDLAEEINKAIKEESLKKTKYKLINMEKYKKKYKQRKEYGLLMVHVNIGTLNEITYKLQLNKWYFIRNKSNVLIIKEYQENNNKLFELNNLYIKLTKKGYKILSKERNKFNPYFVKTEESIKITTMNEDMIPSDYIFEYKGVIK